jgi:hypothetical protein
LAVAGLETQR